MRQVSTMFNPGDVVVLKSGGPEMTIFRTVRGELRSYVCLWFGNGRKLEAGEFHAIVLKAASRQNNNN